MLVVAYFDWQIGHWSPSLVGITFPTALIIAALGTMVLSLGLWRRPRSWEIRSGGIQLVLGGPLFGDRQLIPWGSITHFGGRRTGPDEVCLSFRQQHVASVQTLPGQALTVEEYDRLIDRLRIVIGKRFPQLDLGALA
jgi:hypothetical protein